MKPRKRILSISYDEPLLLTRHLLLQQAGYEVVSALGFTEAVSKASKGSFDLVVMGHSIPLTDKTALALGVKKSCKCPILSIRRHGYAPLPEADLSVDALDGPEALLAAVKSALKGRD